MLLATETQELSIHHFDFILQEVVKASHTRAYPRQHGTGIAEVPLQQRHILKVATFHAARTHSGLGRCSRAWPPAHTLLLLWRPRSCHLHGRARWGYVRSGQRI